MPWIHGGPALSFTDGGMEFVAAVDITGRFSRLVRSVTGLIENMVYQSAQ
ncbi:MAG: hypothetical protein SGJ20_18120 [Planctomycetota bacterium]|nr:hypothetical protein [Planctomycetota bacterium]